MQFLSIVAKSPALVLLAVQACSMAGLTVAGFFAAESEIGPDWLILSTSLVLLVTAPELHSFNLQISRRDADTELEVLSHAFVINSAVQVGLTVALLIFFLMDGTVPSALLSIPLLVVVGLMQFSTALNPALIKRQGMHFILLDGVVNFVLPIACQSYLINWVFLLLLIVICIKLPWALRNSTGKPAPVLWANLREISSLKFAAVIRSTFLLSVISTWQQSDIIDERVLFLIPLTLRTLSALSGLLSNIAGIKRLLLTSSEEFCSSNKFSLILILAVCHAVSILNMPWTVFLSIALIEVRSILYAKQYLNFYFNNPWQVNASIGFFWYLGLSSDSEYLTAILLSADLIAVLIALRLKNV